MPSTELHPTNTDDATAPQRDGRIPDELAGPAKGDRFYYGWVMFPIATLGLCVDLTGSYDSAVLVFAVIPLLLIVLALFATPPHRPRLDELHGEHSGGPGTPPEGML